MLLHDLADRYGPAIVFFNVMGAALGLPVPAMPTLIVVGASVAMMGFNGQALWPHLALMLGIAVLGSVFIVLRGFVFVLFNPPCHEFGQF